MDWIIAEQIELWSLIGVTERERQQLTGLEVDLRLGQKLLLGLCVCLKYSTVYCNPTRIGLQ